MLYVLPFFNLRLISKPFSFFKIIIHTGNFVNYFYKKRGLIVVINIRNLFDKRLTVYEQFYCKATFNADLNSVDYSITLKSSLLTQISAISLPVPSSLKIINHWLLIAYEEITQPVIPL